MLGENGPDARCRAHGERTAEQDARAAAARSLEQPCPYEPLGPWEKPHECEAEHDEDEPRDLLEQELVVEQASPDERGADAERDEERR